MSTKKQLFVFHFAGGSCYSFQNLLPHLRNIEVHQIELPGRGKRMAEDLILNAEEAAADLKRKLKEVLHADQFIIYGHSMGATLGLKVTSLLEEEGLFPLKLIVSGNPGPGVTREKTRYNLPEEEFKNELRELGGIEEEFLNTPELFEFFEPILRADFRLVEEKDIEINSPLNTPIQALMGNLEKTSPKISNWQKFTSKKLDYEILEGDHFFINNNLDYLAEIVKAEFNKKAN